MKTLSEIQQHWEDCRTNCIDAALVEKEATESNLAKANTYAKCIVDLDELMIPSGTWWL